MNIGNCCICLSAFTATEVAVLRECPHTFHYGCILRAVRDHRECPLCRRAATDQDVRRLCIESPSPDGNYSQYVSGALFIHTTTFDSKIRFQALNNAMAVFTSVAKEKGESTEQKQILQDTLMVCERGCGQACENCIF